MSVLDIIRECESEHAEPCRVGEVRFARLHKGEAERCEVRLASGRRITGWNASVDRSQTRPRLRYTKAG